MNLFDDQIPIKIFPDSLSIYFAPVDMPKLELHQLATQLIFNHIHRPFVIDSSDSGTLFLHIF